MARIRTIKPEFFRHEAIQDLEAANIGDCCMLVFEGLWTQCDNQGIFPYKPRQLKLDILPFLNFDMKKTLELLENAGFLYKYSINEKQYGIIPSLPEHQRFNGKEAGEEGRKYPPPLSNFCEAPGKQQGSNGEATGNFQEAPWKHVPAQEREWSKGNELKTSLSQLDLPDPPEPKPEPKTFPSNSDEIRLGEFLLKHILKNNPEAKKPDIQVWAKSIDLMIRIDKRSVTQIREMISWCQKDPFWKANILSTKTLRDKFDQLTVKKQANKDPPESNTCGLPLFVAGDETFFQNPVYDD